MFDNDNNPNTFFGKTQLELCDYFKSKYITEIIFGTTRISIIFAKDITDDELLNFSKKYYDLYEEYTKCVSSE